MKITHNVSASFVASVLLIISIGVWMQPMADASSTNVAYFAVYCPGGGGLSTAYAADNVLTCHKGGAPPLFETNVDSLTTNPNGAHFVTIIEADCFPDTSQVPQAPATPTGHINCGGSPDATLRLGSTFPAATLPSSPPTGISGVDLPHVAANSASIQTILGIVFGIIGALALLVITVSGLRYITSAGDPEKTAKAKNGIIYALVGLVVAISAEAIVAFVVGRL